mgnify:CR=1 FL=1
MIGSSADCWGSKWCHERGACTFDRDRRPVAAVANAGGGCVLKSSADCRRSDDCKAKGLCTYHEPSDRCVAATDSDCKGSDGCKGGYQPCRANLGECVP